MMIVYKIQNKINGKLYIGITSHSIEKRIKGHLCGNKSAISLALKKYGFINFEISLIDKAKNWKELCIKEKYWISYFNSMSPNGYNLTEGGDGIVNPPKEFSIKRSASNIGRKLSEEHKRKIGEKSKGRRMSVDAIEKIKKANTGKKHTLEQNMMHSLFMKGKNIGHPVSEETKRKISESKKGDKNPARRPEVRAKMSEKNKGRIPWNKGLKLSEEHCRNLSLSHMGHIQSEETKEKRSLSMIGHPNWNINMPHDPITGKFTPKDNVTYVVRDK